MKNKDAEFDKWWRSYKLPGVNLSGRIYAKDAWNAAKRSKNGKIQKKSCSNCARKAYPESEWHEDYGPVLWWKNPIDESPHVGTPLDEDWEDGYYTHWTFIQIPEEFI